MQAEAKKEANARVESFDAIQTRTVSTRLIEADEKIVKLTDEIEALKKEAAFNAAAPTSAEPEPLPPKAKTDVTAAATAALQETLAGMLKRKPSSAKTVNVPTADPTAPVSWDDDTPVEAPASNYAAPATESAATAHLPTAQELASAEQDTGDGGGWSLGDLLRDSDIDVSGLIAHALLRHVRAAADSSGAEWSPRLEKAFAMKLGGTTNVEQNVAAVLKEVPLAEVLAQAIAPAISQLSTSGPPPPKPPPSPSKTASGFQDFSPAAAAEESAAPPPPPLLSEKFIENGQKALPALDVTLQVDGAAAADFDAHAFRRRLATLLSVDIAEVDALKLSQADDAANHLNVTTSVVSADATVVDAASRALRGADVNALSYALHVKLTSPPEQHVDLKVPALTFGDVTTMYKGLSSLVGPCPDDMSEAVRCEHCECDDSHLEFLTGNYGVRTTSAIEYHFVVDPDPKRHANSMRLGDRDGRADGRDFEWPFEEKLRADESQRHRCRVAKPPKAFDGERKDLNAQLDRLGLQAIKDVEFHCARLYTGPLFEKYCAVLRGLPGFSAFLTNKYKSLCHGNRYCATIHAINDALIKMSRVTTAEKLYRGVGGFRLPDTFMTPDEWNVRGGVEFGFLSATTDRAVAMQYASGRGSGIVYEIQQGMGDRGASLDWLSQYPHESEVCFPPLLGLELQTRADGRPAKRTEGAVVVVELRPCVGRGRRRSARPSRR